MQNQKKIKSKENHTIQEIHKVSSRLFPPYTKRVAEFINASRATQSEFTRHAIMMAVDGGLLGANERLARIEEQLIWLRKEFSEALE